ncbi:MAG: hypothetical protein J7L12_03945 [Desulfurococcales archaeon]|nr:hypothetical protein [Desulfurococcales archaeon]RLG78203.1 MAG: hypothetical protein DRO14_01295 [Thermoprotei archaeon]
MTEKLTCIVCGRKFPRGQGVIFTIEGKEYVFHSKKCAIKFIRRVIEELDKSALKSAFDKVSSEFEKELELAKERVTKKIA